MAEQFLRQPILGWVRLCSSTAFNTSASATLWRWRSRFYGLPGVAATCASEHWRRDYFGSLFPLHPSGIVPAGPDLSTLVQAQPPALP